MPAYPSALSTEGLTRARRRDLIVARRVAGVPAAEIAEELGSTTATVYAWAEQGLTRSYLQRVGMGLRGMELDLLRLEGTIRELWHDITAPGTTASARAAASQALVKVLERKARMLGWDAPESVQVQVSAAAPAFTLPAGGVVDV